MGMLLGVLLVVLLVTLHRGCVQGVMYCKPTPVSRVADAACRETLHV